jgi:hypothetical protein
MKRLSLLRSLRLLLFDCIILAWLSENTLSWAWKSEVGKVRCAVRSSQRDDPTCSSWFCSSALRRWEADLLRGSGSNQFRATRQDKVEFNPAFCGIVREHAEA